VLAAGIERDDLTSVVPSYLPEPDVYYPNRGYRYVAPLMDASIRLIEKGLLAVVPQLTPGPPRELTGVEAITIVSDINNWWRYDPGLTILGDVDPEDNGVNPIPGGLPAIKSLDDSAFLLTDTDHGQYEIRNWTPPTALERRSSASSEHPG